MFFPAATFGDGLSGSENRTEWIKLLAEYPLGVRLLHGQSDCRHVAHVRLRHGIDGVRQEADADDGVVAGADRIGAGLVENRLAVGRAGNRRRNFHDPFHLHSSRFNRSCSMRPHSCRPRNRPVAEKRARG